MSKAAEINTAPVEAAQGQWLLVCMIDPVPRVNASQNVKNEKTGEHRPRFTVKWSQPSRLATLDLLDRHTEQPHRTSTTSKPLIHPIAHHWLAGATRGASRPIVSNVGFRVLPKDPRTCGQWELGCEPPTMQLIAVSATM